MRPFKIALLATMIGLSALGHAQAAAYASPQGTWEIEMRDSRYRVEMCGDGSQLCGTLIWLGNGADNAENTPYLNSMLIDHAAPMGENVWKGDLHVFGQSASGTIIQVSDDQITLEGCYLGIFCRTYQLFRFGP